MIQQSRYRRAERVLPPLRLKAFHITVQPQNESIGQNTQRKLIYTNCFTFFRNIFFYESKKILSVTVYVLSIDERKRLGHGMMFLEDTKHGPTLEFD